MYMEQNLLIEKEDTKCSNVIKLYKGWLTLMIL